MVVISILIMILTVLVLWSSLVLVVLRLLLRQTRLKRLPVLAGEIVGLLWFKVRSIETVILKQGGPSCIGVGALTPFLGTFGAIGGATSLSPQHVDRSNADSRFLPTGLEGLWTPRQQYHHVCRCRS